MTRKPRLPAGTPDSVDRETPRGTVDQDTYAGVLSMFRQPYVRDASGADIAFLGVPYDLAVTHRPGTRFGPRAIRAASALLAWNGGVWRWPFDPFARRRVVDCGDVAFDFGRPEGVPDEIETAARRIVETGARLLALGGDHFITLPLLAAQAARHGPLALVQFDSHCDTWRESGRRIDHGTMFFHGIQDGIIDSARSIQIGLRSSNPESHGISILDADQVLDLPPRETAARIRDVVGDGPAYLTFDIDFLDPAFAPGTGTPVCGGPSTAHAERILRALGGIEFVGMDIVEVSPPYDSGEITALAAATIALDMVCLWAESDDNNVNP